MSWERRFRGDHPYFSGLLTFGLLYLSPQHCGKSISELGLEKGLLDPFSNVNEHVQCLGCKLEDGFGAGVHG